MPISMLRTSDISFIQMRGLRDSCSNFSVKCRQERIFIRREQSF